MSEEAEGLKVCRNVEEGFEKSEELLGLDPRMYLKLRSTRYICK